MSGQGGLGARIARATTPGGGVGQALLAVHFIVTSSALFYACTAPLLLFTTLVGSLGSHAAVWITAACTVPVWPAWFALVALMTRFAEQRGYPGHTFRAFWSHWWRFARSAVSLCLIPPVLVAALLYNAVLYGRSDLALFLTLSAGAVLFIVVTATDLRLLAVVSPGGVAVARGTLTVARRPWIGLAWVAAAVLYPLVGAIPVVGTVLLLPAPAIVAGVIAVVAGSAFRD